MSLFSRDPVEQRGRELARSSGERALASALTDEGVLVVATELALHAGADRWPWDRVVRAVWDAEDRVLAVTASTAPGEPARTRALRFRDATRLLEVVRQQVTSNLLVAERIESPQHGGAWVSARRVPGADEVRWSVVFDPGIDPRDPERRAWADDHVAALRRSTGV